MIELHPAVQHIADKGYERMTLDEAAIVNLMRRTIADSIANSTQIAVWLAQENPLKMQGPELRRWALEVSEWVLPTQIRRHNAQTPQSQPTQAPTTEAASGQTQATTHT